MIVVIGTNVLVSGLLNPFGKPAAILRLLIQGNLQLAYDTRIIAEYKEVLRRPKFPFSDDTLKPFFEHLKQNGIAASCTPSPKALPDPDDEMFLEVALCSQAEALITGNKEHFPRVICQPVQVYSPAEFLNFYRNRV